MTPRREAGVTESTDWHQQGRQSAHERIKWAVDRRLGLIEDSLVEVRAGFLGYELDRVGNRLIMQLDPGVIDIAVFRRRVTGVAHRANESAHVRGPKLTITVQKGCFGVEKVAALIAFPRENKDRNGMQWLHSQVQLDGRIHAGVRRRGRRARHAAQVRARARPALPGWPGVQVLAGWRDHAKFCDADDLAYAADLQREVGPILAYECGCDATIVTRRQK